MSNEPRRMPIHRSLNRPLLLMGAERNLALATLLLTAMVVLSSASLGPAVIGVVFYAVVHSLLVRMAKTDAMMSIVYTRHAKYASYYDAKPHIGAEHPRVKVWGGGG